MLVRFPVGRKAEPRAPCMCQQRQSACACIGDGTPPVRALMALHAAAGCAAAGLDASEPIIHSNGVPDFYAVLQVRVVGCSG